MNKQANTDHPVHDLIQKRWSPRSFADKMVPSETLKSLLEAARWAASSFNEQPWRMIVATKDQPEEYEQLLSCLGEFNQAWAKSAPVLILTVASLNFDRNGNANRHAYYDLGAAVAQLSIQAAAADLFLHQMAGYDAAKAKEVFSIPEGYESASVLALGYLGDANHLPEELKEPELAPGSRKPLSDWVFAANGNWGATSSLV